MNLYFAAVGYELMEAFVSGSKEEPVKHMLFSYWELSGNAGFKQRKINWENIVAGKFTSIFCRENCSDQRALYNGCNEQGDRFA